MNKQNEYSGTHTWKDTVGCTAVLVAILLGTLSGVYTIYQEAAHVAAITESLSA